VNFAPRPGAYEEGVLRLKQHPRIAKYGRNLKDAYWRLG
jgi:hypothetical protein